MKKVPKDTAAADSTLAIVERELELHSDSGESTVCLRLRKPVFEEKATFRCDLEIEGLGDPVSTRALGSDAVQAYELALQSASLRLLASPAYQSGRLTFQGSHDLRLPVPRSYQFLVRTDLERDRVVREMTAVDRASDRLSEARIARMQDKSRVWPDRAEDAPVVLERTLELRRGRKRTDVRVGFRKPVANRFGHGCRFEIEGLLAKPPARRGMLGEDPIDALRNAMQLAMVTIVSSPAYQRGHLTWLGGYDLGMPILEDVEPLVRKDLHAKFMAKLLMNPPTLHSKPPRTRR